MFSVLIKYLVKNECIALLIFIDDVNFWYYSSQSCNFFFHYVREHRNFIFIHFTFSRHLSIIANKKLFQHTSIWNRLQTTANLGMRSYKVLCQFRFSFELVIGTNLVITPIRIYHQIKLSRSLQFRIFVCWYKMTALLIYQ